MLRTQIGDALKAAMRARDERGVSTLRMIMAGIKDRDIAARPRGVTAIDDTEILALLQAMVKQRRESVTLYRQGHRDDLADKETAEITLIESFLPQPLSDAETAAAIAETGAAGIKDMGKVMAELKSRHAGQLDFAKVGPQVKQALG